MLIPVPLTTWSARREMDTAAWMSPIAAPAAAPIRRPPTHEPVRSEP